MRTSRMDGTAQPCPAEPLAGPPRLRDRPELAAALDAARRDLQARLAIGPSVPGEPAPALRLRQAGGRSGLADGRGRLVRGRLPEPDPDLGPELLYAVGDVHGRYDLLATLLAMLAADAAETRPTVVFLGDYVDRGDDAACVLEALCWLREWGGFDLHLLKGNHEQALLRFLDDPFDGAVWCGFGGAATLRAYGVQPPAPTDPPGAWVAARDRLLRRMPAAHLRLLLSLELMVVIGEHAFVHAGVDPGAPLARQEEADLLWIREEFLEARRGFERKIVHGHSWIDDLPVFEGGRIGLDTGAYATGVLTAARLAPGPVKVLQAKDPDRPPWPRAPERERPRVAPPSRLVPRPADYAVAADELRLAAPPAAPVVTRPAPEPMPARFERTAPL